MAKRQVVSLPVNADVNSPTAIDLDAIAMQAAKLKSSSLAGPQTFAAGDLTGAEVVAYMANNAAPGTFTTRTAAQMYVDQGVASIPDNFSSWVVRIINTGAGTLTLAGGTGVTVTGTATVPQNTWREFLCFFTSQQGLTMQAIGTGTYS